MGKDKPIYNDSRNGYIGPDGTVRDKDLVRVKPSSDENGKYIIVNKKKRYISDLVAEHFEGAKRAKPKAVKKGEDPFYPETDSGEGAKAKGTSGSLRQDEGSGEAEIAEAEDRASVRDEDEDEDEAEAEAEDDVAEEEVTSEDEIEMIADLFKANPTATYAEILSKMHENGYKVSRNQIAEGKRRAGLVK